MLVKYLCLLRLTDVTTDFGSLARLLLLLLLALLLYRLIVRRVDRRLQHGDGLMKWLRFGERWLWRQRRIVSNQQQQRLQTLCSQIALKRRA